MLKTKKEIQVTETPLLVTFLNFYSYTLAFPFRIVYNSEEMFVISTSVFRKVLCLLLQVCISVIISIQVIPPYRWFKLFPTNAALLLYFLVTVSFTIGPQVLSLACWKNSGAIVELCNLLKYNTQKTSNQTSYFNAKVCIATFLFMILHVVHGMLSPGRTEGAYRTYDQLEAWLSPVEVPWWMQIYNYMEPGYTLQKSGFQNLWRIFVSVLHSYTHLSLSIFLVITLSFRRFVEAELLDKIHENELPEQMFRRFKAILGASKKLKQAFGFFIIAHFFMSLTLFAQLPLMYMNKKFVLFDNIILILYFAITMGALYMAMKINYAVLDSMQTYIENWTENLETNVQNFAELGALYHEQLEIVARMKYVKQNSSVGIFCEFFTIDQAFFRSIIGGAAGYAIIVVQLMILFSF